MSLPDDVANLKRKLQISAWNTQLDEDVFGWSATGVTPVCDWRFEIVHVIPRK